MTEAAESISITGDIAASSDVTVNTKGGSVTATIKKTLRDGLDMTGGHLAGATLQFASGQSIVLLAGAAMGVFADAPLRVRRMAGNRFEIELEGEDDEEIDELTASFLRLKTDLFEKGRLQLSEPQSAEDWRKQTDAEFAEARKLIAAARS